MVQPYSALFLPVRPALSKLISSVPNFGKKGHDICWQEIKLLTANVQLQNVQEIVKFKLVMMHER